MPYTTLTGQSLFYLGETQLQHKVLAIAEKEGVRQAAHALKLLQSDGGPHHAGVYVRHQGRSRHRRRCVRLESSDQSISPLRIMNRPIGLSLFSSRRLAESADVTCLVRLLMTFGTALTPTRFGVFEPLRKRFSESDVEALASEIKHGNLYWKSPKSFATLSQRIPGYMHGSVSLDLEEDAVVPSSLGRLLCEVGSMVQADLGAVHFLNDHDRATDVRNGTRIDGADGSAFALFPKKLVNGLPDFYWGMVFGKPYCELFGIEKLLATPAHAVKRLGDELVYVQLTADIRDCVHNAAEVTRARQLAKKHLGGTAFVAEGGLLSAAGQLPLIGNLMGRRVVAPVLIP